MPVHVKKHSRVTINGKRAVVKSHSRAGEKTKLKKYEVTAMRTGLYDRTKSSFIDRVTNTDNGLIVTIHGRDYPYPNLANPDYEGLIKSKSTGSYYNKHVRGMLTPKLNKK